MSLDWSHIEQWQAGEIALLGFIAGLLLLLIVLLVCIIHYGRLYRELKRHEPTQTYNIYPGDGPWETGRPENYPCDSSDDEEDPLSGMNNVNMSNNQMRLSMGAGPLIGHKHAYNSYKRGHQRNYTTTNTRQSMSSDSKSSDSQSNLKAHIVQEDSDDSVQKMYSNPQNDRGHQYSNTIQPPPPQYNYVHPQHAAPMQMFQGTYGNEIMQQQVGQALSQQQLAHLDHVPPPPPGVMHSLHPMDHNYGANISPMRHSHRPTNSGSFDTRTGSNITSITGNTVNTGALSPPMGGKILEYPSQNPIDDHLDEEDRVPHFIHSPSKSQQEF